MHCEFSFWHSITVSKLLYTCSKVDFADYILSCQVDSLFSIDLCIPSCLKYVYVCLYVNLYMSRTQMLKVIVMKYQGILKLRKFAENNQVIFENYKIHCIYVLNILNIHVPITTFDTCICFQ